MSKSHKNEIINASSEICYGLHNAKRLLVRIRVKRTNYFNIKHIVKYLCDIIYFFLLLSLKFKIYREFFFLCETVFFMYF